ncbi:copper chaperone PCu(A)C [uncultured Cohaesibacter sp.]|uniref:copper chaperone PCu(A)C n=1 Tax=uncultured Cohaesibacter sp. TaxID=1002546 RepID=UPI0029C7E52F|nr:copper chaperone PCu(A)C [uncultured Cohaesibacter sp.]
MLKEIAFAVALVGVGGFLPDGANPVLAAEEYHEHAHEEAGHEDHDHHVSELKGLRSVHAWTRAAHKGEDALVFVELQNHSGEDAAFKGGEFDHAVSVELVGFVLKDGKDTYVPVPGMPLKAGQELHLEPKGLALRLNGIEEDFHKGESFEMHFVFERGEMEVDVLIEAEDAKQHSHAGHMHE